MIDFKKETAKLLAGASKNLAQVVASASFEFWQRKDFRLYVNFDNISKTEQDRIFNELEVSVFGLFILKLEQAHETSQEERKIVLTILQKDPLWKLLRKWFITLDAQLNPLTMFGKVSF